MRTTIRFVTAVASCALLSLACSDSSGNRTGLLTVRLTDTPFPFSEVARVDVFVVRVDARTSEASDEETATEARHEGWTTVAEQDVLVNLLDLSQGRTTNLGATTLRTGTYNGFRLV